MLFINALNIKLAILETFFVIEIELFNNFLTVITLKTFTVEKV